MTFKTARQIFAVLGVSRSWVATMNIIKPPIQVLPTRCGVTGVTPHGSTRTHVLSWARPQMVIRMSSSGMSPAVITRAASIVYTSIYILRKKTNDHELII